MDHLAERLQTYPNPDTPGFQTLFTAKQEFQELGSILNEPVPPRGSYFRHQLLVQRALRFLPRLLLMHRTGTGKTCAIIAFTEYVRALYETNAMQKIQPPPMNSNLRNVFILVRGPTLKNEFQQQLICRCTRGQYETEKIRSAIDDRSRRNLITREVNKWYNVMTYHNFASLIGGGKTTIRDKKTGAATEIILPELTDAQIIEKFSDSIFFVDEVHNLRNIDLETDLATSENPNSNSDSNEFVYRQLWRVFHLIERSKVVLATATPMVNSAADVIPVMNLLLPADQQMPSTLNVQSMTLPQLEPYFRGKISYVRELDTGAVPIEEGIQFRPDLNAYVHEMDSTHQLVGYRNAQINRGSFRKNELQASNFVFPDFSYGGSLRQKDRGFGAFVERVDVDLYRPTETFQEWLSNPDLLRKMSAKYSFIVETCRDTPGVAFCYTDYVSGSGAIVLGLAMEANGFDKFNEITSVFQSDSSNSGLTPYCNAPGTTPGRRIRIEKKNRYALITSETSESKTAIILELLFSYENRYGEYIKAVIGSPITQEGFNFNNGLQFHLIGPTWSPSVAYQALSRILRATSHVVLINEERQRLISEGKDPNQAKVYVRIYNHASIVPSKSMSLESLLPESVDLQVYDQAAKKEEEIQHVEQIMKECAIDCQIHFNRNSVGDSFVCVDPPPSEVDRSTYDLYYLQETMIQIIDYLKLVFQRVFETTIPDLMTAMQTIPRKYIDQAIQQLIDGKTMLLDRYGVSAYLQRNGDRVYLDRTYTTTPATPQEYWLNEYAKEITAIQKSSLQAFLSKIQSMYVNLDPNDPQFEKKIDDLTLENRVKIFEDIIRDPSSAYSQRVQKKFATNLFAFPEPIDELEQSKYRLSQESKKAAARMTLKKLTAAQLAEPEPVGRTGETIYIHTIYTDKERQTSYSVASNFLKADGQLRIYKPSEKIGWRDLLPYEIPVYNAKIQRVRYQQIDNSIRDQIYGMILSDNEFRLIPAQSNRTSDARKVRRGRNCASHSVRELLDVLWELQLTPPTINYPDINEILQSLNNRLKDDLSDFSDDQLRFYYAWATIKRSDQCQIIQEFLDREGRLIRDKK